MSASPRRATVLLVLLAGAPLSAEPVRLAGRAFGWPVEIEVRDLESAAAESAIAEAFGELEKTRLEARALEETARAAPAAAPATPAQLELLRRAQGLCFWSEGTLGPAGGELLRIWGALEPVLGLPTPEALEQAISTARCDRLELDLTAGSFRLAPGSALELTPFALGWGVDRAAERLRARGAANFWIAVGPLARAAGAGPDGRGWRFDPPPFAGQEEPLGGFFLRDRALAILTPELRPLRVGGERYASFVDFRRGRPAGGVVGLMVVSELAVDAYGVGYVMFARGPREGTMLLGTLPVKPSIRWLLGTGSGPPVLTDANWSVVPRR